MRRTYQRCGTAWHPALSGLCSRSGLSGAAPAPCTRRLRGKGSGCTGRRPPPAGRCHAGRTKRHRACHLKRMMTQKSTHTVRLGRFSEQGREGQLCSEGEREVRCVPLQPWSWWSQSIKYSVDSLRPSYGALPFAPIHRRSASVSAAANAQLQHHHSPGDR